jgi:DNA-binding transcriptional regulator YhcF (GntR family)
MSGYFVIRRSDLEHPALARRPYSPLAMHVDMVGMAAWRPYKRNINGKTIQLQRGEFTASVRFLAERWGVDKGKVERAITRFKTETLIETRIETGQLVIRICNYDEIQLQPSDAETVSKTPDGMATRQQQDSIETKKNSGNSRNEINTPESPSQRGTRLPDDFVLPPAWRQWAESERPDLNIETVLQDFRDYWHGVPSPRGVKANWQATWRRWIRRENVKGNSNAPGRAGRAAEREQRAHEDERRRRAGLAAGLTSSGT